MLLNRLTLHMLPPRAVLLAADIVLLFLPEGDRAQARLLSGSEPPYGTVDIHSAHGPSKIAAIKRPADWSVDEAPPFLQFGDDTDEAFAHLVLGADIADLAEDLDLASRRRLLAFLLGFCRKAFDLGSNPDFASACICLAQLCVQEVGKTEPVATVSAAWTVLDGLEIAPEPSLFVLNNTCVRRTVAHPVKTQKLRHVVERISAGDLLLALGEQPTMWTVGPASAALPDLIRPQRNHNDLRAVCLRVLAPISVSVSAQVRELSLVANASPIRHDDVRRPVGAALEAALPDAEGQIFLRGWLRDPMQLVRSLELHGPCGSTALELGQLHRFRRPDIDRYFADAAFGDTEQRLGFVAYVADPSCGLSWQPTMIAHLHSGSSMAIRPAARHPIAAASRTAVLTSVQPDDVSDAMLDSCIGPAAAALHREALAHRGRPDQIQIGTPVLNPAVSIIVPLYRNLSFLRFQIASFATDPDLRWAELIFVLDSPEQRSEAEHLLRGLHAMHDLPITLLVMTRNSGYAAANNAAAGFARGRHLLLLNSDVVPARPGWLSTMQHRLSETGVGAVGPKLLFDDGSIQHAGLYFDRDIDGIWFNAHYGKGMPRLWPSANRARAVPGVTGAALLVHRSLFEQVGGICDDYIIGDYEDSDFCLRLHKTGATIHYEPSAELFHFERRSIALHKGYAGTLACRYNRRLHHRRWDCIISDLMSRPEHRTYPATETA